MLDLCSLTNMYLIYYQNRMIVNPKMAVIATIIMAVIGIVIFVKRNWKSR